MNTKNTNIRPGALPPEIRTLINNSRFIPGVTSLMMDEPLATAPPAASAPASEPKPQPKPAPAPAVEVTFTVYAPTSGKFVGKRIMPDGSGVYDGFPDTDAATQTMSLLELLAKTRPNFFLTAGVFDVAASRVVPKGVPDIKGVAIRVPLLGIDRRPRTDRTWGDGRQCLDGQYSPIGDP